MSERFGTLRSILQQTPGEAVWREIVAELERWGEEERDAVALPYVLDHLDRWPVEIERWVDNDAPEWRRRLANSRRAQSEEELRAMVEEGSAGRVVALDVGWEANAALWAELGRFGRLARVSIKVGEARDAEALVGARWPPGLEELEVELDGLDDSALAVMADAPVLRVLRDLSVQLSPMPGIARMLASPHLTGLRELTVRGTNRVCWGTMCGNAALAGVERLSVDGVSLTDDQLEALARSVMSEGITSLELALTQPTEVAALFEQAAWPALRSLSLHGQEPHWPAMTCAPMLSGEGAARLVVCGVLGRLERLSLLYNLLGDVAVEALANSGQLGALRELELAYNQIGDAGLIALIERGGMHNLKALGLARNQIGDAGAAALARSPLLLALTPDKRVPTSDGGLLYNSIGRAGVLALLRSPHLDSLEKLELFGNPLTPEDIVALAATPEIGRLRGELWVNATDASEEMWQALLDSPYANEATRSYVTWQLERLRRARGNT